MARRDGPWRRRLRLIESLKKDGVLPSRMVIISAYDGMRSLCITEGFLTPLELLTAVVPRGPPYGPTSPWSGETREEALAWTVTALARHAAYRRPGLLGDYMSPSIETWVLGPTREARAPFFGWFEHSSVTPDYRLLLHGGGHWRRLYGDEYLTALGLRRPRRGPCTLDLERRTQEGLQVLLKAYEFARDDLELVLAGWGHSLAHSSAPPDL